MNKLYPGVEYIVLSVNKSYRNSKMFYGINPVGKIFKVRDDSGRYHGAYYCIDDKQIPQGLLQSWLDEGIFVIEPLTQAGKILYGK